MKSIEERMEKPSNVHLGHGGTTLTGTLGKTELEFTAGLLILTMVDGGDTWRGVTPREASEAIKRHEHARPWLRFLFSFLGGLYTGGLVRAGFATSTGKGMDEAIALTPKAIRAICEKWTSTSGL